MPQVAFPAELPGSTHGFSHFSPPKALPIPLGEAGGDCLAAGVELWGKSVLLHKSASLEPCRAQCLPSPPSHKACPDMGSPGEEQTKISLGHSLGCSLQTAALGLEQTSKNHKNFWGKSTRILGGKAQEFWGKKMTRIFGDKEKLLLNRSSHKMTANAAKTCLGFTQNCCPKLRQLIPQGREIRGDLKVLLFYLEQGKLQGPARAAQSTQPWQGTARIHHSSHSSV